MQNNALVQMSEQEYWKVIEGFKKYEVSNIGNVRNIVTKRILVPRFNDKGYHYVRLNGSKHKRVHRLVAVAFIENPHGKITVNHKNGNKADNSARNLEWNTYSENNKHAHQTGLNKGRGKRVKCVETGKVFSSTLEAERQTGICNSTICRTANRITKTGNWTYV